MTDANPRGRMVRPTLFMTARAGLTPEVGPIVTRGSNRAEHKRRIYGAGDLNGTGITTQMVARVNF